MHDTQASNPSNSLGKMEARVRSLNPMPPPLRSTCANSPAAAGLSGNVQKAHSQMIASKDESATGKRSASPALLNEV
jgi:hypothetical protein